MLRVLSYEQKDAVLTSGNVLLRACPGSGKTRTLTYKIGYELQKNQPSKKIIIAVTFTNRAADEIKKRIQSLDLDDSNLWAGTIHSFCLEWIIRPYRCYCEELKNGFTIADEYYSERLIHELKKEYGLSYFTPVITRYTLEGEIEEFVNKELIEEYHSILKKEKLIDFDQILHYAYQILKNNLKVSNILKNMFHLVCVDEYQDTQELQYAILASIMRAKHGSCHFFMVGDADQAIYGSLGGVAKSLEEIEMGFGCKFVNKELSGNYRSNQKIIDYYRNFQMTNIDIEALGKNANEEGIIQYIKDIHKDNLVDHISQIIQEKINLGIPENEICVLAPNWFSVISMGRRLKALLPDVNFDAVGLSPLLKNKENIWFKFSRLFLLAPTPKTYLTRKRWCGELVNELKDIGVESLNSDVLSSKKLLRLINSIHSNKENGLEYLEECFDTLLTTMGLEKDQNEYLKIHWETFFKGAKERLENPDFNLAHDIDSFRKMFQNDQGVVVNTCHGIKGEEFDTVIAFSLLHGRVPNWNENNEEAANKLLYVICSRAKRELHLISEFGHTTQSGKPYVPTSQLLNVNYDYD